MMTEALTVAETLEPIAKVQGQDFIDLPQDLYIPPDALRVFLEAFEGPLDLLLYLIKKQNVDILDIPIAKITAQYMEYVELMRKLHWELIPEYLLMAAMLAEIKSRMLLPRTNAEDEDEGDPRAELIRRLQEYERFKEAAENIATLPQVEKDIFLTRAEPPVIEVEKQEPNVEMFDLLRAFKAVLERSKLNAHHHIKPETLSIRERMTIVLGRIKADMFTDFGDLFDVQEGSMGVVVTFIAILELLRQQMLEMVQAEPFAPIHVKAVG